MSHSHIDIYFIDNPTPSLQGFLRSRYCSTVKLDNLMNNYVKSLQNVVSGDFSYELKTTAQKLLDEYKKVRESIYLFGGVPERLLASL
jgi:hypothetical protein